LIDVGKIVENNKKNLTESDIYIGNKEK